MNASQVFLPLIPGVPLAFAILSLLPGMRKTGPALVPMAALIALVFVLTLPAGAWAFFPWLLLGGTLQLDETGRVFLLFTALLWGLSGWHACGYTRDDPHRKRFFVLFLISMAGNFGVIIAGDLLTFFFAFAVLSLVPYGLVVHNGSAEARRAGRIYAVLVIAGEVLLLAAFLLIAREAGSDSLGTAADAVAASPLHDIILILLLGGFGLKAGLVPLHFWLPLAHPAAPVPASAVLSGALIKAGLLGMLRLLPLGSEGFSEWSSLLLALGLFSAFWGAAAGVSQTNPKTVLAYSSISQMGLITVGLGIGLNAPGHWDSLVGAVLLYIVHHALAKGALFLGVGVAPAAIGPWRLPVVAGLVLPALALAGAPLTSGAAAKMALKSNLSAAPDFWFPALPLLLSLAAVGTTLLMVRFLYLVLPRGRRELHGPTAGMIAAWGILTAAVVLFPWFWGLATVALLQGMKLKNFFSLFWPISLGMVLGWGGGRFFRRRGYWRIPPGDLVVPLERLSSGFLLTASQGTTETKPRGQVPSASIAAAISAFEGYLARWPVVGTIFLVILLLLLASFAF